MDPTVTDYISWTAANGVCWLRDLLPSRVPEARILTYSYDANTRGKEQLSPHSLYTHGQELIRNLNMMRKMTEVSGSMLR